MSASEVKLCCEALRELVLGIMDPTSNQQLRIEAQQFCDDFKAKSPLCVPCGLMLADNTEASAVRCFGFQILEHVVTFRWPVMSLEERESLKNRLMSLISAGTAAILQGEPYIRDAAARVLVEMIKRDWPLRCPMMLIELQGLSQKGALQAELVLFTLLRLAEDVVTFDKLPPGPGNLLKSALNQNMRGIFSMVENLLQHYVNEYKRLETDPAQETQAQVCCRVAVAALNTLAGYMGWVRMCYIEENCYKLVKILWNFLNDPKLQLEASECLLIAINRIGSGTGICALFADIPVQHLCPAQTADGEGLTDRRYCFLQRQCHLLCLFIKQLCLTMDFNAFVKIPSNFGTSLDILLDFTTHSSQFLSSLTQSTWRLIFRHALLSRNPFLRAMVPKYLRAARKNLVKVGFPSKNNSPSCEYSRLEFVCDDDFCEFLATFHDEQKTVIEAACRIDQRTCYQMVIECLKYQLSASLDPEPKDAVTADSLCHASSQSLQQWEATMVFVKVITETLFKILKTEDIPVNDLIELLQLVMNFKTEDPLILACVQTNISTLFPFLNYKKQCSSQILSKLIDLIEEMKDPKAQSLKSVRRSVCSRFIQLCRDNAQNLLLHFEVLNEEVKQLLGNEKLMQMEKGILMQAMVIIINQFKNYEQQKALLEELMAPMASVWLSEEMKWAISKVQAFIQYVGANLQITDTVMESPTGRNRSRIMDCVLTMLGVLKWSRWPTDLDEAKAGGFVTGFMHSGRPIYRNPCTEKVRMLLKNVFLLIRTQHHLYFPNMMWRFSHPFAKALDLLEVENTSPLDLPQPLLDICDPPEYNTELERMQAFFCTLYETCFSILGHAGSSMNNDFYTMEGIYGELFQCVFPIQHIIPHYRLLSMVRAFLKPLVHCCNSEYYETLLCPIIKQFLDCCNVRLSDEWNIINQRNEANKASAAVKNPESQKTPENQVKLLTGEVMEFLFACCVSNKDTSVIAASSDVCCVSNEDADNTGCTTESDVASVPSEDASVIAGSHGADSSAAAATSDDVFCVSNEDASNTGCTTESDVANVPNKDGSVMAASSDVCCVSNEDADNTGCTTESDVASVPSEDASVIAPSHGKDSSVGVATSDVCCVSNGDAENTVCTAESDDDATVCKEDAATGVAALSDDDFGMPTETEYASVIAASHSADSSVVSATSDDDCCVPTENEAPSDVLAVEFDDGEMAAEVPQPSSTELGEITELTGLSMLGVCLLKAKARRTSLLRTAFSSLLWNDSLTCYKIATRLCWPLLKQALSEPLSVDDMVHVFSMVLSGIQKHKNDRFSSDALVNLAFHICESMRCRWKEKVMSQVALTKGFYLQTFDLRGFCSKIQEQDNMSKDDLKHLIKECTKKASGNTSQDDCMHIPAPFLKRKNPTVPILEPNNHPPPKMFF